MKMFYSVICVQIFWLTALLHIMYRPVKSTNFSANKLLYNHIRGGLCVCFSFVFCCVCLFVVLFGLVFFFWWGTTKKKKITSMGCHSI